MSRKWKIRLALASSLVIAMVIAGILVSGPAYEAFKRFRAQQLVAGIAGHFESGDWHGYEVKLLAAANLAPRDREVMLAQARYLSVRQHPAAIGFWMQVAREHPRSPEVWDAFFLSALQSKDYPMAALALEGFRRSDPDALNRAREHEVQLLAALGRIEEAIHTARVVLREGNPSEAFSIVAHKLLLGGTEKDRQEAMSWFWAQAEQSGNTALAALVTLGRMPELSESQMAEIVDMLRSHPNARLEHGYLAAALESRPLVRRGEDATPIWRAFIDGKPLPARVRIARWLIEAGNFDLATLAVGADDSQVQRNAALIYLEILGEQGDWESFASFVSDPQTPLQDFMRQLFLARSYSETGDVARFEFAWRRAFLAAQRDAAALSFLANYAEVQHWDVEAEAACRLLIDLPDGRIRGWMGLYNLGVKRQDTVLIRQAGEALDRWMLSSRPSTN